MSEKGRVALTRRSFNPLIRLHCGWLGCDPDFEAGDDEHIPCRRCGNFDVSLADCLGATRNARIIKGFRRLLRI